MGVQLSIMSLWLTLFQVAAGRVCGAAMGDHWFAVVACAEEDSKTAWAWWNRCQILHQTRWKASRQASQLSAARECQPLAPGHTAARYARDLELGLALTGLDPATRPCL